MSCHVDKLQKILDEIEKLQSSVNQIKWHLGIEKKPEWCKQIEESSLREALEVKAKTTDQISDEWKVIEKPFLLGYGNEPDSIPVRNWDARKKALAEFQSRKYLSPEDAVEVFKQHLQQLYEQGVTGENIRFGIDSLGKVCDWEKKHHLQDMKFIPVDRLKELLEDLEVEKEK